MQDFEEQDNKSIIMAEIMPPDSANFAGRVHGGHLMLLLDRLAYACAARYAGRSVVTLSVDHILFKQPIEIGELVTFYANVNYFGNTSMEIGIKVIAENLTTKAKRHTNTCYFTMVGVDDNGKPTKLKPLTPKTKLEKYRFQEAKLRKEARMSFKTLHNNNKKTRPWQR